jgi:hypothetical protein
MAAYVYFAGGTSVRVTDDSATVAEALKTALKSRDAVVEFTQYDNSVPVWVSPTQVTHTA